MRKKHVFWLTCPFDNLPVSSLKQWLSCFVKGFSATAEQDYSGAAAFDSHELPFVSPQYISDDSKNCDGQYPYPGGPSRAEWQKDEKIADAINGNRHDAAAHPYSD